MRKFTIGFLISLACGFTSYSQQTVPCGTDEREAALEAQYPELLIDKQKLNEFVAQWIENNKDNGAVRDGFNYVIPVVYHIIHDYGTENISDDQVRDDIKHLNIDYQLMNADTSEVIPEFKSIIGAPYIEFRLANKTPGGLCTNGIEHIHSLACYSGGENSKLSPWPRSMYLNIWTVKSIPSPPGSVVGAYATPPSTVAPPFLAPYDGVLSRSDAIGTIGTFQSQWLRTIPHEVGHILNLNHTWGNGPIATACGDDGIFDTPITKGWFSVCPLPENADVCTPGVIENYQNIMDYSSCKVMFTKGQADVMVGALNAPTADRNNLFTQANLIATGTDDTIYDLCVPRVDFYSSLFTACTGTSITFHDVSWAGTVDSREWTFTDGNPATSTSQDPIVTFSGAGWKSVTLSVTNAAGTATETRQQSVYISEDHGELPAGSGEDFEDPTSFNTNYIVQNRDDNESAWQRTTTCGYLSNSSVMLNNYGNLPGDIDNLITPSYDLSGGGPLYLSFYIACASHATSPDFINDVLKIYSSTDCGKTWIVRSTISGVALANAGYFEKSFVPPGSSQWTGKSILLTSALYDNNVRFRFEYTTTSGDGNNCYIDDINVSAYPVGINDPAAASFDLKVFPNPTTDVATVSIQQKLSSNVEVKLMDQMGRIVNVLYNGWLTEGTHEFEINASKLDAGMYYLMVDDGLTISREKLIVQ